MKRGIMSCEWPRNTAERPKTIEYKLKRRSDYENDRQALKYTYRAVLRWPRQTRRP